TMHRGVDNDVHNIRFINQDLSSARAWPPLWEILVANRRTVGIVGSLQSYPPLQHEHCLFHVPDTFAKGPETIPARYRAFQALNLELTRENKAVASTVRLSELLAGFSLLRAGVRPSTGYRLVSPGGAARARKDQPPVALAAADATGACRLRRVRQCARRRAARLRRVLLEPRRRDDASLLAVRVPRGLRRGAAADPARALPRRVHPEGDGHLRRAAALDGRLRRQAWLRRRRRLEHGPGSDRPRNLRPRAVARLDRAPGARAGLPRARAPEPRDAARRRARARRRGRPAGVPRPGAPPGRPRGPAGDAPHLPAPGPHAEPVGQAKPRDGARAPAPRGERSVQARGTGLPPHLPGSRHRVSPARRHPPVEGRAAARPRAPDGGGRPQERADDPERAGRQPGVVHDGGIAGGGGGGAAGGLKRRRKAFGLEGARRCVALSPVLGIARAREPVGGRRAVHSLIKCMARPLRPCTFTTKS